MTVHYRFHLRFDTRYIDLLFANEEQAQSQIKDALQKDSWFYFILANDFNIVLDMSTILFIARRDAHFSNPATVYLSEASE